MPYPRFTKTIINHFLFKHQSLTKLQYLHTQIIKDDGIVSRLKFVRIGEDYLQYGLPILKTMLTVGIKQSDSYKMFIKYSTCQIPPEKNFALELGKYISLTKAAEEDVARQVHATHARIVTEPVLEPARRRPSGIAFRDTSSLSKKMSSDLSQKLKGSQTLTPKEQIAADTMKALKEKSEYTKEEDDDETIEWVDTDEEEEKKDDDDNKSINLEQTNDEETVDEFVHGKEHVQDNDEELVHCDEQVNDHEDEEITNAKVEESRNGDEEITESGPRLDAEKLKKVKDDAKKSRTSPNRIYSYWYLQDTADAEINSLLDIKIESEVPHIQSPPVLTLPVSVIFEPSVLTPIPKTPLVAPATTLLPLHPPTITIVVLESNALTILQLRVASLEKDVFELKKIDHSAKALASLKS
ncbi:hypothetical protein Tco_0710517 [Tanacetum coccineum]